MMTVALEERTFSEVKRLCCAGLDGPELLGRVVERLRRTVPFEAYCASTADPGSGLITHSLAGEMGGAKEAAIFFERIYFEHDLEQLRKMARERSPVLLLSESTVGYNSPRRRELLAPLGLAHEMRVAFTAGGRMWGSMDLIRERGRPDFVPRETALLKRLAPHLGVGLRAAAVRARATVEQGGSDEPGVLTLDRSGRVAQHTPAAERWLHQLEDQRSDWREWDNLPSAVRMVAFALRRALSPENDRDLNAIPRLRTRARSGRWLTLYGSLTEASSNYFSETVIVIEPSKPEEVAWMNVAACGLTTRE
ncbi:MAG: GAF domain-containing protein, partial [Actinomycetota bacterium]|nr:GAF domain-containing protein [Actinomycetota bacterium]